MKNRSFGIIIALLILALLISLSLASYADTAVPAQTAEVGDVIRIDASIVTLILAGAAVIGGLFGYWLVRSKK